MVIRYLKMAVFNDSLNLDKEKKIKLLLLDSLQLHITEVERFHNSVFLIAKKVIPNVN